MDSSNNSRKLANAFLVLSGFLVVFAVAFTLAFVAGNFRLVHATNSGNSNILASANVIASCFISLSTTAINFGNVPAGSSTGTTQNMVTVNDPFGNAPANIFVYGTNWYITSAGSANFVVSNTLWAPNTIVVGSATALSLGFVDTAIQIPAPNLIVTSTSNNIFFGAQVPKVTPIGTYDENIILENQC